MFRQRGGCAASPQAEVLPEDKEQLRKGRWIAAQSTHTKLLSDPQSLTLSQWEVEPSGSSKSYETLEEDCFKMQFGLSESRSRRASALTNRSLQVLIGQMPDPGNQ